MSIPEVVPCLGPLVPPHGPCKCPESADGINVWVPVEVTPGKWECHLVIVDPGPSAVPVPIPTVSEWGLILMAALLAAVALRRLRP